MILMLKLFDYNENTFKQHIFTARTRRIGKVIFLFCVSVYTSMGGVPPSHVWMCRGTPFQVWTGWGTPLPARTGWVPPCQDLIGYPPSSQDWMGYPLSKDLMGHPPPYAAGGMPFCVHAGGLSCYELNYSL